MHDPLEINMSNFVLMSDLHVKSRLMIAYHLSLLKLVVSLEGQYHYELASEVVVAAMGFGRKV